MAVVARWSEDDFRWLAELLRAQAAVHPERAGFARDALVGLEWADAARGLPKGESATK